jgi:ribosomal-protein-alanine N-acetyltransferase
MSTGNKDGLPTYVGNTDSVSISLASREFAAELRDFYKRNMDYHQPWSYNSDDESVYFDKVASKTRIGLFVWDTSKQHLIGVINLNEPVYGGFKSAYIGYCGDYAYSGRGYIKKALALVIDYAFNDLGFHRLEANIQPGNAASIRMVEQLGFTKEGFSPKYLCVGGLWCDHERWAIIVDNWKAQN